MHSQYNKWNLWTGIGVLATGWGTLT